MNNYGVVINEIGMRPMVTRLQRDILQPIARLLFPRHGSSLDSHHAFMVQYRAEEDAALDMHHDDSDVTFNICLGRNFSGSALTFCGLVHDPDHRQYSNSYSHVKGRALVHLGEQRHGADQIMHFQMRDSKPAQCILEPDVAR